jgi:cytoskeletal protein RodZ
MTGGDFMARLFSGSSANLRSYFSHFGRGFLIIVAIIIIAGLAVAAYLVGDEDRQEASQPTTDQQQTSEATPSSPQPAPSTDSGAASQNQAPGTANTGPSTLINTGPDSKYGAVTALLAILVWAYLRSNKQLVQAQLKQI